MKIYHKRQDRTKWNKWFAWYPVYFDNHYVWLETIKRREIVFAYDIVIYYKF